MSYKADMRYELEKKRRKEVFDSRVRAKTAEFVARYRDLLMSLEDQGLSEYTNGECSALLGQVDEIERYLASDPVAARELSQNIGDRIYALPKVARAARKAAEQAMSISHQKEMQVLHDTERLRIDTEKKLQGELENTWQSYLLSWEDVLARQLSFPELAVLREQLFEQSDQVTKVQLIKALDKVKKAGEQKAEALRVEQEALAKVSVQQEQLQSLKSQITDADANMEQLNKLSLALANSDSLDSQSLKMKINNISNELDNAVVDESCRKEVVKAIYQSLRNSGFTVEHPKKDHNKDEVVIRAAKPAGSQARFRVRLDGGMEYKFDHYKGSACKSDINQVLPKLQSVYGIKLSDERVIWENPDDVDKEAKPQPTMSRENG